MAQLVLPQTSPALGFRVQGYAFSGADWKSNCSQTANGSLSRFWVSLDTICSAAYVLQGLSVVLLLSSRGSVRKRLGVEDTGK